MMYVKIFDLNDYMGEVELKLLEEINYELELENGFDIVVFCVYIFYFCFLKYYLEYSIKCIFIMDWLEGKMFLDYLKMNFFQEERNWIG